jgi:hypothetical protein
MNKMITAEDEGHIYTDVGVPFIKKCDLSLGRCLFITY